VPTTQLFPQVIDASTLGAKLTSPIFFPIGIEGQADAAAPATVGQVYKITTPAEADTNFGATSRLAQLIKFMLTRGAAPIYAGASIKSASLPTLLQRQAVWDNLASDSNIRLRLTDSLLQSDFAALGTNLDQANVIFNKQIGIVGMASATSKANLITAAAAIASKRMVLVGPGVYDESSPAVLRDGGFLAAAVAAEIAKNGDPTNDLDLWTLPLLTGIEKDATGFPLLRVKTVGGVATNDFEDLLQGGVSPVMEDNGVTTTHLRTTYTTDGTFDSLMTRIIVDQVFVDVRDYLMNGNFLRLPNSESVRGAISSGVEALLFERRSWITPKTQSDGTIGYNVQVTSSPDNRQVTVAYSGTVVRGISTIQVAATLDIPV